MIKLEHITKSFNDKNNSVHALSDISLTIESGKIFGIVGKSGVGKSTLLKILSLSMRPDSGQYFLFNKDVTLLNSKEKKALLQETSFIYQNFSLLYNLNVLDNVALPLKLRGVDKVTRHQKARQMLEFVGLIHKSLNYPMTLSGGEAQRISIARALITNPKLFFLDEPTSALDEETSYEILKLIKRLHETFKPTIIFVSHQIQSIKYLCDRVMLLEDNKVKRIGPIQKLDTLNTGYDAVWGEYL
ncbi:MAG: ATP-binding cassette domain-containing protein [Acholeplasma sp.]